MNQERTVEVDPAPVPHHSPSSGTDPWQDRVGDRVTVTGKAVNRKVGAFLSGDDFGIYVDLPETHWPSDLYHGGDDGDFVQVTGTVRQRADLPVFIPDQNAPSSAGIPVQEGTDLQKAAKRYILESVEWIPVADGNK